MNLIKGFLGDNYNKINEIINCEYGIVKEWAVLIGSSNYPFKNVLASLDAPLNFNPYEGVPGRRYFPKSENIDRLETLGAQLTKKFFNIENDEEYKVTFQPYSGTQANQIVYNAMLKPKDKLLTLKTNCGSHVSHTSFTKQYYEVIEYGLDKYEIIDYAQVEKLASLHKPKLLIAGASSYPRLIRYDILGDICERHNIILLADISHTALYISTGDHVSPFGFADFITFTTHKTTRGIRGGVLVYKEKYSKQVERSIFPITQGAPKFTDILSKAIMFTELNNMDKTEYAKRIIGYSQYFSEFFMKNGIKLFTNGTDTHFVVIDLSNTNLTGIECEKKLEEINILTNRNSVPNDKYPPYITSGLRVGFLTLATLNFRMNDFERLTKIIYEHLFTQTQHSAMEVSEIMRKYTLEL